MIKNNAIKNQKEWLALLSSRCFHLPATELGFNNKKNDSYIKQLQEKINFINPLAYDLSNCEKHNNFIIESIENLIINEQANPIEVANIVNRLTSTKFTNTYGAFCELAGYRWLAQYDPGFSIQIPLHDPQIMGKKSIIDGQLNLLIGKAFFDIKGFGFHSYVIRCLREKIQEMIPDYEVSIEGSWAVSIEELEKILKNDAFNTLLKELKIKKQISVDQLLIGIREKKPVMVSKYMQDPYLLAEKNATYPYRYSDQFTRDEPFILIFVIHPWLGDNFLHENFSGQATTFTRAFARRVFMQNFNDIKISDASKLLSAMMFINIWPIESTQQKTPAWIYLNPRAKNRLTRLCFSIMKDSNKMLIDDFMFDNY